jgi:hypothetical protein
VFEVYYSELMRRRGNPNWGSGRPLKARAALPSAFEVEANRLGLTIENYATSGRLRLWCEANRNRCYIPEWLLERWHIPVEPLTSR